MKFEDIKTGSKLYAYNTNGELEIFTIVSTNPYNERYWIVACDRGVTQIHWKDIVYREYYAATEAEARDYYREKLNQQIASLDRISSNIPIERDSVADTV